VVGSIRRKWRRQRLGGRARRSGQRRALRRGRHDLPSDLLSGLPGAPFQATLDGASDGFVAEFAATSGQMRTASYFGGAGWDSFAFNDCLELDPSGRPGDRRE
jgi:hypothetical protein